MRLLLPALALLTLTAAAPTRDWTRSARMMPTGGVVLGNPAARVKLVEYASYTCPHCAHFARDADPVLRTRLVRGGSTSWDYRSLVRDRLDLAAAVLARCGGAAGFFAANAAIFAAQDQWLERGLAYQQANATRLQLSPVPAQLRALADGAGLSGLMRARGLADRAADACFADTAAIDRIVAIGAAAPPEVDATPTFFINGKVVPRANWSTLEPALRAAGAR